MGNGVSRPDSAGSYNNRLEETILKYDLKNDHSIGFGLRDYSIEWSQYRGWWRNDDFSIWGLAEDPLLLLTYVPERSKGFAFSNTHCVYTNDLARAERLPRPRPLTAKKREIFNPKAYVHVDKRTESLLNANLNGPITELVHKLVGQYTDDIAKVRALYIWFTSQPVERTKYTKSKRDSTAYQLWHLQQKYINYADFFSVLCWFAGIPSVIIRGFLKGSTYSVGQNMLRGSHVGEWNAVLVGGQWRLIDTFWGACTVTSDSGSKPDDFFYVSEDGYFLTDPERMIYSHFPDDSAWQLLKNEKTLEEFESMAVVKERFFDFRMELLSHFHCITEAKDGKIAMFFQLHPSRSLKQTFLCIPSCEEHDTGKLRPVKIPKDYVVSNVTQNGKRKELSVKVRFPVVGTYRLDILGKENDRHTPGYDFDWVAVYKVIVNDIPGDVQVERYSNLEAEGFGPGPNLKELGLIMRSHPHDVIEMHPGSLNMVMQITDPAKFLEGKLSVALIDAKGNERKRIAKSAFKQTGKTLRSAIDVPEGKFEARIDYQPVQLDPDETAPAGAVSSASSLFTGRELIICKYHVLCTPLQRKDTALHASANEKPLVTKSTNANGKKDELSELRNKLNAAIDAKDPNLLELAIKEAESKGYAKDLEPDLREAKQLLAKMSRLQKAIHEVMSLDQRTIAEIKSYNHPIPKIHTVMQATMLLLGHSEEETKEWKSIQILIGKTGKMSLKRRIKELNMATIDEKAVERSQQLLEGVAMSDIVQYSVGVAAFYSWSVEVATAASSKE